VTIIVRITVDGETKQFSMKKTILPERLGYKIRSYS